MMGGLKFGNKPLRIRWYLSDSLSTTPSDLAAKKKSCAFFRLAFQNDLIRELPLARKAVYI